MWHYTLDVNYWLSQRRIHRTMLAFSRRLHHEPVYDFTIWRDGRRVAAWTGRESDAFNALLHFAACEDHGFRPTTLPSNDRPPPASEADFLTFPRQPAVSAQRLIGSLWRSILFWLGRRWSADGSEHRVIRTTRMIPLHVRRPVQGPQGRVEGPCSNETGGC